MSLGKVLDVPTHEPEAFEVLRVWAHVDQIFITLRYDVFEDAAAWGIFLVDLAHHIANALEQEKIMSRDAALDRIWQGLRVAMDDPPDSVQGAIQE